MSDVIEQAFKDAGVSNQPLQETSEVEQLNQDSIESNQEAEEGQEQDQNQEQGQDQENNEDEVVFPKKAINAISRRDKKIAKLQNEYQEAIRRLDEIERRQSETKQESVRPDADSFDSFDDYIEALVEWKSGKGKAPEQVQQQQQITPEQVQQQVYYQQRAEVVDTRDAELIQKLPDYEQLKEANADILGSFTPDVVKAVYEADDAPLSLYVLAKEGKLESLNTMSPYKAAMELAKAESRGQQFLQRRQTKAPTPISGVRGRTNTTQTVENMSADQLMDWVNKKG